MQAHEVAILTMTPDDRFLRFVVPEKLQQVGQIPLTSTNSLASRTVREKRPEVINHFAVVPHSSVFEAVPIVQEERGEPIQKIMSVAITHEKKIVGVLQISRKGRTAAEAGADFTHSQLRELKTVADTIGAVRPTVHADPRLGASPGGFARVRLPQLFPFFRVRFAGLQLRVAVLI